MLNSLLPTPFRAKLSKFIYFAHFFLKNRFANSNIDRLLTKTDGVNIFISAREREVRENFQNSIDSIEGIEDSIQELQNKSSTNGMQSINFLTFNRA